MKKLLITALLMLGLSAAAPAQQGNGAGAGKGKAGSAYVDKNHNNVCDNFENKTGITNRQGQRRGNGYGPGNGACQRNAGWRRGGCRRSA